MGDGDHHNYTILFDIRGDWEQHHYTQVFGSGDVGHDNYTTRFDRGVGGQHHYTLLLIVVMTITIRIPCYLIGVMVTNILMPD